MPSGSIELIARAPALALPARNLRTMRARRVTCPGAGLASMLAAPRSPARRMDLAERITGNFRDSATLKLNSAQELARPIARAIEAMVACLRDDGKILSCGNGGSAADAQ